MLKKIGLVRDTMSSYTVVANLQNKIYLINKCHVYLNYGYFHELASKIN